MTLKHKYLNHHPLYDQSTGIIKKYIPLVWNSRKLRLNILQAICDNSEWTERLIKFEQKFRDEKKWYNTSYKRDVLMLSQTIKHDIEGLMKKDKHFLPRI